ncbi:Hypothetical predicted protein [Mytilus galloprovincialis]|uniref:Uncharacterized protein n=1 Tax=Mytilus galloprovincialis TaxID=29158 RepID=A0A8B6FXK7_MYTGA|nr:Hypothetical predicted protein [Mytilus galloprovincialis]
MVSIGTSHVPLQSNDRIGFTMNFELKDMDTHVSEKWTVLVDYKLINLTERHITTGSEAVTYKRRDIQEIRIVCDLLQDLRTVGPGRTILPTSRNTSCDEWEDWQAEKWV